MLFRSCCPLSAPGPPPHSWSGMDELLLQPHVLGTVRSAHPLPSPAIPAHNIAATPALQAPPGRNINLPTLPSNLYLSLGTRMTHFLTDFSLEQMPTPLDTPPLQLSNQSPNPIVSPSNTFLMRLPKALHGVHSPSPQ